MNTNKTTLSIYNHISGSPFGVDLIMEFDIYQNAIDYVETFTQAANTTFGATFFMIYLYSYDFTSYSYYVNAGVVTKATIVFPRLLS